MATANKTYEAMFLFPASAATELEKAQTTVRSMVERHEVMRQHAQRSRERRDRYARLARLQRGVGWHLLFRSLRLLLLGDSIEVAMKHS